MHPPLHDHALTGCAPMPLASYLKALGILRLVAEQADPDVRGWWRDESFWLRTRLDRDALYRFFLEDYRPSPIAAPWNGGSGFYQGDNTDGFAPLRASNAPRFAAYAATLRQEGAAVRAEGFTERPKDEAKSAFVARLRATLPDAALPWLDAALAVGTDGLSFPPLLGTGGNDGRLDFTNNFMRRLVAPRNPAGLFHSDDGRARPGTAELLATALFGSASAALVDSAIGQFAPGAAGGPNASTGFEGGAQINGWDFVLMIEGTLAFAGATSRRLESGGRSSASFPFCVRTTGAGWGGVALDDEENARAEFWAPLWNSKSSADEIARLLAEGRAVLKGRTVRDGLEFARAAASLGVSRGIVAFQRYGFVMRSGKAYLATPLGRRPVRMPRAETLSLIEELERASWLDKVRLKLRDGKGPARGRIVLRALEESLFGLTAPDSGGSEVEAALTAIGGITAYLSHSPRLRDEIRPPPRLSGAWLRVINDDRPSAEFRVAAALASLGWGAVAETDTPASRTSEQKSPPIMAAHFAPLNPASTRDPHRDWDDRTAAPDYVWGEGGLVRNLLAVLNRRLLRADAVAAGGADDPLAATLGAPLADIVDFLAGRFDDGRCAALLAGLVWVRPPRLRWRDSQRGTDLPLAYAACKPLFTPRDRLRRVDLPPDRETGEIASVSLLAKDARLPVPPGLVARLVRGEVGEAGRDALHRARASGLASPLLGRGGEVPRLSGAGIAGERLAAALLIPLDDAGLVRVLGRVFDPFPTDPEAA